MGDKEQSYEIEALAMKILMEIDESAARLVDAMSKSEKNPTQPLEGGWMRHKKLSENRLLSGDQKTSEDTVFNPRPPRLGLGAKHVVQKYAAEQGMVAKKLLREIKKTKDHTEEMADGGILKDEDNEEEQESRSSVAFMSNKKRKRENQLADNKTETSDSSNQTVQPQGGIGKIETKKKKKKKKKKNLNWY